MEEIGLVSPTLGLIQAVLVQHESYKYPGAPFTNMV